MSTKSTITYSDEFHFYHDLLDEDKSLYLEINEPCGHGTVIKIPAHIWEAIRNKAPVDFSLVDIDDEKLQDRVREEVHERIREYKVSGKPFLALFGFGVYGDINSSVEEQVATGLEFYIKERAIQRSILEKLKAIK